MNKIIQADALKYVPTLPDGIADAVFLDPPYTLNHSGELERIEGGKYRGIDEAWDKSDSRQAKIDFILWYLKQAKRLCKPDGTVWVSGTFHNIYDVGHYMLELGYHILNDVKWVKRNPTPQIRGTRFTNATETLLWARAHGKGKYYFDYQLMKTLNHNKQMRTDWNIPLCTGKERLYVPDPTTKSGRVPLHPTQKPLELLKRVILSSVPVDGLIIDFLAGVGTTAVAASAFHREFIIVEREPIYIEASRERLSNVPHEFLVY